ncbi:glycosyltransferase family 4 protein [Calothrix sp. 336/3]|uniref:glycosyltransferase family 4 protein n=1 Tax=Calothrix sp. 336/3 TaxID=1337936 RepID=UPI0004E416DC|nr:glycosyltransferase family 4 protein [Calothrix sp. 336/3]AKG23137.1 glycosyl transferase group 1 [Calothrix sp. 336/3]
MLHYSQKNIKNYLDLNKILAPRANHLFVFLEVFAKEGGIQSYVKDVFRSYLNLNQKLRGEVFLLRDAQGCENPFASELLKFHYFKSHSPQIERVKMTTTLLSHLMRQRPQHVFCGHVKLAPMIGMLCQPLGIPYTVMTHGKEVWQPLDPQTRTSLQKATHLWTVSNYTQKVACAANQLDPQKVKILPCAVNTDKFTPGEKSSSLRSRYGLQNSQVLMTVARLWSGDIYKGVDITIQALPKICQVFPDVKYLVIGRGDDQPRLAQLAQDLGVSDRVVFAGFVPTEELVEHYRLADAYIMPSQEGFGIVYLEAMACGIPVLSGDNDGSADPLQNGRLGWRVPHRDVDAVAAGCIEILQGEDKRCQGEWLREEVIANFGIAAFQKRMQAEFLAVLDDR